MPSLSNDSIRIFKSRNHPNGQPAAAVYAQAMAVPVGVCSIPVMLLGLNAALLEQPLFPELAYGFALALLISWVWSRFTLRRRLSEIFVRDDAAAVRSIDDSLHNRPLQWKRVFQVRRRPEYADVAIGRDEHTLHSSEWNQYELLLDELDEARFAPYQTSTQ